MPFNFFNLISFFAILFLLSINALPMNSKATDKMQIEEENSSYPEYKDFFANLINAAKIGDIETVEKALQPQYADIFFKRKKDDTTELQVAVVWGQIEVAELLLQSQYADTLITMGDPYFRLMELAVGCNVEDKKIEMTELLLAYCPELSFNLLRYSKHKKYEEYKKYELFARLALGDIAHIKELLDQDNLYWDNKMADLFKKMLNINLSSNLKEFINLIAELDSLINLIEKEEERKNKQKKCLKKAPINPTKEAKKEQKKYLIEILEILNEVISNHNTQISIN